jgi:helix-turn-helix protein
MGEPRLIEQAYRFALAPTPEEERFLDSCAGASRFFYNWGLALVETRLRLRRAYGPSVAVPWSYKELCSDREGQGRRRAVALGGGSGFAAGGP